MEHHYPLLSGETAPVTDTPRLLLALLFHRTFGENWNSSVGRLTPRNIAVDTLPQVRQTSPRPSLALSCLPDTSDGRTNHLHKFGTWIARAEIRALCYNVELITFRPRCASLWNFNGTLVNQVIYYGICFNWPWFVIRSWRAHIARRVRARLRR